MRIILGLLALGLFAGCVQKAEETVRPVNLDVPVSVVAKLPEPTFDLTPSILFEEEKVNTEVLVPEAVVDTDIVLPKADIVSTVEVEKPVVVEPEPEPVVAPIVTVKTQPVAVQRVVPSAVRVQPRVVYTAPRQQAQNCANGNCSTTSYRTGPVRRFLFGR